LLDCEIDKLSRDESRP